MPAFDVVVKATSDDNETFIVGLTRVEASGVAEAQAKAQDEVWDDRLTSASCTASFETTEVQRYIVGNWSHIFADSQSGRDLRLVFDTLTKKVIAMHIKTGLGYTAATPEAMADVEDSLIIANEDALQNPEDWDLERTSTLPVWVTNLESVS